MKRISSLFLFLLFGLILSLGFALFKLPFLQATEAQNLYEADPEIQALNKQIADNQNEIDNLKKATAEYAQKIEDYGKQAVNLKNQLSRLENQIIKLELDVRTTQLQIDKSKLEIASMDMQINKEQREIDSQKTNLIEYIKTIDKVDQKSYLEILILNDSFSEFFNQLNYLEEIQSNIQSTVERLKNLKNAIEVQKADKERQKNELEKLKTQQKTLEEKLVQENDAKQFILLETQSSEVKFEKLLVEAKQRQGEIDNEISGLKDIIKEKVIRLKGGSDSPLTTLERWPLADPGVITSYFHDPDYPYRYVYEHPAIDIATAQGSQLLAPAPGYVARVKDAGYGYSYIIIIHDNNLSTVYGHVSAIYVKEDTYVQTGDVIGLSGGKPKTKGAGNMTTGPHLHFEVRLNGIPVNPLDYLP